MTARRRARVCCAAAVFGWAAVGMAMGDGAPADEGALTLSVPFGAASRVVAVADWAASPPALQLVLLDGAGHAVGTIPMPATTDAYSGLLGLDEADLDGDGDADLLLLAEYATGIGPSGADPFPQGMVWLRGPDGFTPAPSLVETANAGGELASLAGLAAAARAAAGS